MNTAVESLLRNHRLGERVMCTLCKGMGFRPEFSHIAKGRCFPCGGQGHRPKTSIVRRRRTKPEVKRVVVNIYKGTPWSEQLRLRAYSRETA